MDNKYFNDIKIFVETKPVISKALGHLRDGACVEFRLEADETPYYIIKEKGKAVARSGVPEKGSDCEFYITNGAVEKLVAIETDDLGQAGLIFLQILASHDPIVDVALRKINSGVLTLVLKGYLGLILACGAPVMGFLAKKGFGSAGAIKRGIEKRRAASKK